MSTQTLWWIKGDGCDLVSGLKESVSHEWSGDVDLNDGQLQKQYEQYRQHLHFIQGIGLGSRQSRFAILVDLKTVEGSVTADLELLVPGKHKILCSWHSGFLNVRSSWECII